MHNILPFGRRANVATDGRTVGSYRDVGVRLGRVGRNSDGYEGTAYAGYPEGYA